MIDVFCCGQGESREHISLPKLHKFGKIIGCNEIYFEFFPDIIFTNHKDAVPEILSSGFPNLIIHPDNIPDGCPKGGNTGPLSVHYAAQIFKPDRIFLLGHDVYGHKQKDGSETLNHLYMDKIRSLPSAQHDYVIEWKPNTRHLNYMYFITELERVFLAFPHINFFRVGRENDIFPTWQKLHNIKLISYDDFWDMLATEPLLK
jgi:hypothetical protein